MENKPAEFTAENWRPQGDLNPRISVKRLVISYSSRRGIAGLEVAGKYVLMVALLLMALGTPAGAESGAEWTGTDTALELGWQALHFADWMQTLEIARKPEEYFERNVFLGRHPSTGEVNAYMASTAVLHLLVSAWLDKPYRTAWQGITIVEVGIAVWNNHDIGLSVTLAF